MSLKSRLLQWYRSLSAHRTRTQKQSWWEDKWSQDDYAPKCGNRGIAAEIIEAVETGWFPAEGTALDIGCGRGEIAAWFAQRGYSAVGFDIAESAVRKAREMHKHMPLQPLYVTRDISAQTPPNRQYNILVDHGCLHQVPENLIPDYVRNIATVAAPDARLLLFVKAYRKGIPYDDPAERQKHVDWVRAALEGVFTIEKHADTYIDDHHGKDPETALPAIVFWMRRTPTPGDLKSKV